MPTAPLEMSISNFRTAVATNAETANYSLVRLTVPQLAQLGETKAEMVLVLDRSGSMFTPVGGARPIDKVIDATEAVIKALRPADRLGIVVFDDRASLKCPLTAGETRKRLLDSLAQFRQECQSDFGGGTELTPALQCAVEEVRRNARDPRAARLVVLTDGQAGDPDKSIAYVRTLERQNIAALGFGDFDFDFMNKICEPSKGMCEEVGKKDPTYVKDRFMEELKIAQDTVASNLRLCVEAMDFLGLRKTYLVKPRATYLGKAQLGLDRKLTIDLPVLEKSFGIEVLFDLIHRKRDAGEVSAAEVTVLYDLPSLNLKDQELVGNIVVEYTTDPMKLRTTDPALKEVYDKAYDEELRVELEQAEKSGDKPRVDKILDTMRKSGNQQVVDLATKRKMGVTGDQLKELSMKMQQESRRKTK